MASRTGLLIFELLQNYIFPCAQHLKVIHEKTGLSFLLKKKCKLKVQDIRHISGKRFSSSLEKKPRLQFSNDIYDWANYKNNNFHYGKLKTKVQTQV